jgi:hypothetical protein
MVVEQCGSLGSDVRIALWIAAVLLDWHVRKESACYCMRTLARVNTCHPPIGKRLHKTHKPCSKSCDGCVMAVTLYTI